MRFLKVIAIIATSAVLAISLPGCGPKPNDAGNPENVLFGKKPEAKGGVVVDYGNNVYYFRVHGAPFANALSLFLSEHGNLRVSAMAGDGNASYGADQGYFVVFEQKTER